MSKLSIFWIILFTVAILTIYGLSNAGIIVFSPIEFLTFTTSAGEYSVPLGSTDGLLILSILAATIIFIPAVRYLRKK